MRKAGTCLAEEDGDAPAPGRQALAHHRNLQQAGATEGVQRRSLPEGAAAGGMPHSRLQHASFTVRERSRSKFGGNGKAEAASWDATVGRGRDGRQGPHEKAGGARVQAAGHRVADRVGLGSLRGSSLAAHGKEGVHASPQEVTALDGTSTTLPTEAQHPHAMLVCLC